MKILITQPQLEQTISQLENELLHNSSIDIAIFPEGYLNENVEAACILAKQFKIILIGGYRRMNDRPKDRAIIIDRSGTVILDRIKYSQTTFVEIEGLNIGHILCDELIVQGIKNESKVNIDLMVHPIGVGMFSEEQFQEWVDEARRIAIIYNTMIIGTSHADGSYGDTGVSIPIAYCFDKNGKEIFIAKNDVGSRLLNTKTRQISKFP